MYLSSNRRQAVPHSRLKAKATNQLQNTHQKYKPRRECLPEIWRWGQWDRTPWISSTTMILHLVYSNTGNSDLDVRFINGHSGSRTHSIERTSSIVRWLPSIGHLIVSLSQHLLQVLLWLPVTHRPERQPQSGRRSFSVIWTTVRKLSKVNRMQQPRSYSLFPLAMHLFAF